MAHRYLICAALAGGVSRIGNIALSKDISATLDCIKALGAKADVIESGEDGIFNIEVSGINFEASNIDTDGYLYLPCNESGSTLRFLIPICLTMDKKIALEGKGRLLWRPLSLYEDICAAESIEFSNDGSFVRLCGKLKAGEYKVAGDVSSQFISGLLFALPMLDGDSKIVVSSKLESASYVDMTLDALRKFGIIIEKAQEGGNPVFKIKGAQRYVSNSFDVEGDWSNAAFFDAFNHIGGNVKVEGLSLDSLQGDKIYREYFEKINEGKPTLDLENCPDLAPVLFALAAAKNGAVFTGTYRLKLKESDRSAAMASELAKFGVDVIFHTENKIEVVGRALKKPDVALCSHNDHRIVMALSILCSLVGAEIEGAEAVSKSMPDFFDKIRMLGVDFRYCS